MSLSYINLKPDRVKPEPNIEKKTKIGLEPNPDCLNPSQPEPDYFKPVTSLPSNDFFQPKHWIVQDFLAGLVDESTFF